jgi:20S proteasome alpha/beta subunit
MTIAIGTRYDDGAIVCADTKVVSTDGSTSTGSKAFVSVSSNQLSCAVANAADDAHAAKMLASHIADAVGSSLAWTDVPNKIKKVMTDWYRAFGAVKPPALHFLLASGGQDHSELYFCEPPNTVWGCHEPMAIGQGARPLDNITSDLFRPWLSGGVKGALLKLAFLMHRAKTEEGSACGGATQTLIVTKTGRFAFIERDEMEAAEKLAKGVEDWLMEIRKSVLGGAAKEETAKEFAKQYLYLSSRTEELKFPSLTRLERPLPWENRIA